MWCGCVLWLCAEAVAVVVVVGVRGSVSIMFKADYLSEFVL